MSIAFKTTDFLSVDEVLQIHIDMCENSDTHRGVMAQGLLRTAALAAFDAAQTGAVPYEDLNTLAAIYAQGIVGLRPFAEGNERVGWLVVHQFLFMNDVNFEATFSELENMMGSGSSRDGLADFIQSHSEPLSSNTDG